MMFSRDGGCEEGNRERANEPASSVASIGAGDQSDGLSNGTTHQKRFAEIERKRKADG